jgi:hypothetical protein
MTRIVKPPFPTVIVDNFFETPEAIRSWALTFEFFKGNRGNWSGLRSEILNINHVDFHHLVCRKLIPHIPNYNFFEYFDCSFHICKERDIGGWVHQDSDDLDVAGMVYLNPEPPQNSGTWLYDRLKDRKDVDYVNEFVTAANAESDEIVVQYEKYRNECNSHFTPNLKVENRFNRMLLFDARQFHSAADFFGTTNEDSRLTLVFFGRVGNI